MAIQGVGGAALDGGLSMSFRQINIQADLMGKQVTSEKMAESIPHVSNFGVETNLGTSHFQQENQELIDASIEKVSEIMERDDDLMEVSNTGSESPFSSSSFQEMNTPSAVSSAQQQAASAYSYFG